MRSSRANRPKGLVVPGHASNLSTSMALPTIEILNAACRTDFASFIRKCYEILSPGSSFQANWHIHALTYHLEQVRLNKIKRLIINMPPRSLKSIMSSVAFPAFILGHEPAKRIIAVSYGADLAVKHANDFRAVVESPWYRGVFPWMRISVAKNTESEVLTTQNGYRLATSIDGTLTGRGGEIVIIDDPLKPIDAHSDSKRQRVNDWFRNTLVSRLDDKRTGAIIVVMQRVHMDDLTGMLLRDSTEWTALTLPAIAEFEQTIQIGENERHTRRVGDLLHPEREPISVLDAIRSQLGTDTFAAQYQQAPIPPGGAMIKRNWIRRFDQSPASDWRSPIFQSWDTASKEGSQNDWSVCTTWVRHENKYYLIDALRGRFDYPTLKARAISYAKTYEPEKILIEDTGVGTALIAELQDEGLYAIAVKPERDKITRMSIQSGKFESGQIWFPNNAPWLADLEAELFAFPNGRHDDQVDSISQALAHHASGYDSSYSWVGYPS
jgi:predicted phage terminase large subunit-like protein